MAWVKRREQWDHTCSLIAVQLAEPVDPTSLNPLRKAEAEKLKTPAMRRMEAAEMMALIGSALGDKKAAEKWLSTATTEQAGAARESAPEKRL